MSIPEKDGSIAPASKVIMAKSSRAGEEQNVEDAEKEAAPSAAVSSSNPSFHVADVSYSSRISSLSSSPFRGIAEGVSYGRGVPVDTDRNDGMYTAMSPEHPANVLLYTHEMTKYERKIASLKILKEEKALLDKMADIVIKGKVDKAAFKEAMTQFTKGAYNGREADGMLYISTVNEVMGVINKKLLKCGEREKELAKIGKHLEKVKELVMASLLEGQKGALTASSVVEVASLALAGDVSKTQEYSGLCMRRDVARSKISTIKKGFFWNTIYVGDTALDVKPANPSKYAEDLRSELTRLTEGTMEVGEIKRVELPSTGKLGL